MNEVKEEIMATKSLLTVKLFDTLRKERKIKPLPEFKHLKVSSPEEFQLISNRKRRITLFYIVGVAKIGFTQRNAMKFKAHFNHLHYIPYEQVEKKLISNTKNLFFLQQNLENVKNPPEQDSFNKKAIKKREKKIQ